MSLQGPWIESEYVDDDDDSGNASAKAGLGGLATALLGKAAKKGGGDSYASSKATKVGAAGGAGSMPTTRQRPSSAPAATRCPLPVRPVHSATPPAVQDACHGPPPAPAPPAISGAAP
jgi:hypothetical protein